MAKDQPSTTIVIFGASGDLTSRKLLPALFHLAEKGKLPDDTRVVGFARRPYSHDDFRELMREGVEKALKDDFDAARWKKFARALWYSRGDLGAVDDFGALKVFLEEVEDGPANRLYYLATAPEFYEPVIENLRAHDLHDDAEGWRRVIVEKPFGSDLKSAAALNDRIHATFREDQVYRIDHYLGKETVQNILFFRFANAIFEPIWNRNYIDHVQISVAEDIDVGQRAGYYEQSGVMRDMFQNHLLQLLALVTIEPPNAFDAVSLRNEKVKVLTAIRPIAMTDTVRAQYEGYHKHRGVDADSQTPTFAALKLYIDNWRWQDVPFYLRSGKALAQKTTEIIIQFRRPPHLFFNLPRGKRLPPNILSLCIQPDEGIHLQFQAKVPGSSSDVQPVDMEFHYGSNFNGQALPDAYERLLLDALLGDATLFTHEREITLSWKLIDSILSGWDKKNAPPLVTYDKGSWGPEESEMLLADDGRVWRRGCGGHDE